MKKGYIYTAAACLLGALGLFALLWTSAEAKRKRDDVLAKFREVNEALPREGRPIASTAGIAFAAGSAILYIEELQARMDGRQHTLTRKEFDTLSKMTGAVNGAIRAAHPQSGDTLAHLSGDVLTLAPLPAIVLLADLRNRVLRAQNENLDPR